jgi:hypothetical protein
VRGLIFRSCLGLNKNRIWRRIALPLSAAGIFSQDASMGRGRLAGDRVGKLKKWSRSKIWVWGVCVRVADESEARAWIGCFGSRDRCLMLSLGPALKYATATSGRMKDALRHQSSHESTPGHNGWHTLCNNQYESDIPNVTSHLGGTETHPIQAICRAGASRRLSKCVRDVCLVTRSR